VTPTPPRVYYATAEEARDAYARGWNLRCNLCGSYGAMCDASLSLRT
jgi:hypothetical protein